MPQELYTKKEYESLLLKTLGRSPKLRIIDFFMDNPLSDFTNNEVIEALGMGKQTFQHYKTASCHTILYKLSNSSN